MTVAERLETWLTACEQERKANDYALYLERMAEAERLKAANHHKVAQSMMLSKAI